MKYIFLKLLIIAIFITYSSCYPENGKTSQNNFDKKTNTIAEIDSSILLTEPSTNQFFQRQKLETKIEKKANNCFFQTMEFDLPNISEALGDTLNIQNVHDWVTSLKSEYNESEIRNIIGGNGKYFRIRGNDLFEIIGYLIDEGEYLGVNIYSIDKENCQILGEEIIAETTAWENGYKESYSIILADFKFKKIKNIGAKDWGDGTQWKRDTLITIIDFEKNGNISLEKQ